MSDLGTPEIIGISAVCMFLLRLLEKLIDRLLTKNGHGYDKKKRDEEDTAGAKNVEFWQMEYQKMEDRIIRGTAAHLEQIEARVHSRLNDIYNALQTLIRWKGGD